MSAVVAVTTGQWIIIGLAGAVAAAGFGLMAINLLAIVRPRKAGEGPPRPLIGKPPQMSRRAFFRRALGAGFGLAMLDFSAASLAFLWPSQSGGFGGKIRVPDTLAGVKEQIRSTRQPYYYGPGKFYLVPYDGDVAAAGYDDPIAAAGGATLVVEGLQALYQRCVHLGCRVPFCQTSQWFECPCHGSKYNLAGEYKAGPAPRGLDRFPLKVENGVIEVDTSVIVTGPPRGTDTTGQQAEGAFCVELEGAE